MTVKEIVYHPVSGKTNNFLLLIIACLPAILLFPFPASVFSNGVDPPLAWVFNFLIDGNLSIGKNIIFPHGPLAFLMYPLPVGVNLWVAVSIHLVARIFLAYGLLKLATHKQLSCLLFALASSFVVLALNDLLLTLLQVLALCYLNFFERRNITWLIPALILTALTLYIKAFVGIVSIIITLTFAGIMVYRAIAGLESWYRLLLLLIVPLVLILTWLGLYGDLIGFAAYFRGMVALAADNSAAVAVYPDNNWWLLSLGLVSGLLLVVFNTKNIFLVRLTILLGPALFAIWKYGMAREDYLHASMMFVFILFIVLVYNIIAGKHRILNLGLSLVVAVMFYLTALNAFYFEPFPIKINGAKTLVTHALNNRYFADTCSESSNKFIERNRLNSRILKLIGTQSVDIYPWDYTYIAANKLNWQPRPVIQSYACYTRKLDERNATHFRSAKAPEFIIWELRKITHDIHGGTLESIDGRYLLNDEPATFTELLKRYELADTMGGVFPVLVFRKKVKESKFEQQLISKTTSAWNTWITVPDNSSGILKASVDIQRSLAGDLKSFFYKDDAAFVYYMLENGDIRMYRIVPKNAAYGLWINPLIMNPEKGKNSIPVKKIMFRCQDTAMMKDQIGIEWNRLAVKSNSGHEANPVFAFFGVDPALFPVQIHTSINSLEETPVNWSVPDESKLLLAGQNHTFNLLPERYSVTYTFSLDSLKGEDKNGELAIRTGVWAKSASGAKAVYVISIEKNGEVLLWKAVDIQNFIHDHSQMNFATNFAFLGRELLSQPGLILKVYAWNTGKEIMTLDDFSVRIETW